MLLHKLSWFYNIKILIKLLIHDFFKYKIWKIERRKNIIKYHHLFEFIINKLQIAKGAKDITNTRFLNKSNVAYPS